MRNRKRTLALALVAGAALHAGAGAATITVTPASNLRTVVANAAAGDTLSFAPGDYRVTACIDVTKRLAFVAQTPGTVQLLGSAAAPRSANAGEASATTCALNVYGRGADGLRVEGLTFAYFRIALYIRGVANLTIARDRFVSNFGDGVVLRDTADAEVRENAFLDPYLVDDPPGSVEPWYVEPVGVADAQMDYGISIYGSFRPRVHHNYFFGVFNQALSFKIANRDAYAGYNTFEGFNLTALFFGQEPTIADTFPVFGGSGVDGGRMVAEGNVFRPVRALHPGTHAYAAYRARTPLRVHHVDGTVILRDNVVEASVSGIEIECTSAGCPHGSIELRHNLVQSRVITPDGVTHDIGPCAVQVQAGTPAAVLIDQNTLAWSRYGLCADGGTLDVANVEFFHNLQNDVRGTPAHIDYDNHFRAGPVLGSHSTLLDPRFAGVPNLQLRTAAETYLPNRTATNAYFLTPTSPGLHSGRNGNYRGAFGLAGDTVFGTGFE